VNALQKQPENIFGYKVSQGLRIKFPNPWRRAAFSFHPFQLLNSLKKNKNHASNLGYFRDFFIFRLFYYADLRLVNDAN
jgi:hypothetical protein